MKHRPTHWRARSEGCTFDRFVGTGKKRGLVAEEQAQSVCALMEMLIHKIIELWVADKWVCVDGALKIPATQDVVASTKTATVDDVLTGCSTDSHA